MSFNLSCTAQDLNDAVTKANAAAPRSTTYTKTEVDAKIPAPVTVDQTYDSTSTNAQSGTAVAQAIAATYVVTTGVSSGSSALITSGGVYNYCTNYGTPTLTAKSGFTITDEYFKYIPYLGLVVGSAKININSGTTLSTASTIIASMSSSHRIASGALCPCSGYVSGVAGMQKIWFNGGDLRTALSQSVTGSSTTYVWVTVCYIAGASYPVAT